RSLWLPCVTGVLLVVVVTCSRCGCRRVCPVVTRLSSEGPRPVPRATTRPDPGSPSAGCARCGWGPAGSPAMRPRACCTPSTTSTVCNTPGRGAPGRVDTPGATRRASAQRRPLHRDRAGRRRPLDLQVDGAARRRDHRELDLAAVGVDGADVQVTVLEAEGELVGAGDEAHLVVVGDHRGRRGQAA